MTTKAAFTGSTTATLTTSGNAFSISNSSTADIIVVVNSTPSVSITVMKGTSFSTITDPFESITITNSGGSQYSLVTGRA